MVLETEHAHDMIFLKKFNKNWIYIFTGIYIYLHISFKRFSDPVLNVFCKLYCASWKPKWDRDLQIEIGDCSLMCLHLNINDMHTKVLCQRKRESSHGTATCCLEGSVNKQRSESIILFSVALPLGYYFLLLF